MSTLGVCPVSIDSFMGDYNTVAHDVRPTDSPSKDSNGGSNGHTGRETMFGQVTSNGVTVTDRWSLTTGNKSLGPEDDSTAMYSNAGTRSPQLSRESTQVASPPGMTDDGASQGAARTNSVALLLPRGSVARSKVSTPPMSVDFDTAMPPVAPRDVVLAEPHYLNSQRLIASGPAGITSTPHVSTPPLRVQQYQSVSSTPGTPAWSVHTNGTHILNEGQHGLLDPSTNGFSSPPSENGDGYAMMSRAAHLSAVPATNGLRRGQGQLATARKASPHTSLSFDAQPFYPSRTPRSSVHFAEVVSEAAEEGGTGRSPGGYSDHALRNGRDTSGGAFFVDPNRHYDASHWSPVAATQHARPFSEGNHTVNSPGSGAGFEASLTSFQRGSPSSLNGNAAAYTPTSRAPNKFSTSDADVPLNGDTVSDGSTMGTRNSPTTCRSAPLPLGVEDSASVYHAHYGPSTPLSKATALRSPVSPTTIQEERRGVVNACTGLPIPVPQDVQLVDSSQAFRAFNVLCQQMLQQADMRDAPADRYLTKSHQEAACRLLRRASSVNGRAGMDDGPQDAVREEEEEDHVDPTPLAEDFSLAIALDLEGYSLGRNGRLSIITVATTECVYVIDVVLLPAYLVLESGRSAFADVLASPRIMKLMYDCRADCDAVFFQYGVQLAGVCDLQVGVGLHLTSLRQPYLVGMKDAFSRLQLLHHEESVTKASGRNFFDERTGGSGERWEERPLNPLLLEYCAIDVKHFFEAFYVLRKYVFLSCYWACVRINTVVNGMYDAQSRKNALCDFRDIPAHMAEFTRRFCERDPV